MRLIIIDEIIFQHTLWLVDHWPLNGGGGEDIIPQFNNPVM